MNNKTYNKQPTILDYIECIVKGLYGLRAEKKLTIKVSEETIEKLRNEISSFGYHAFVDYENNVITITYAGCKISLV